MAGINRQHKDRLFRFIFGNPEHKDWTLSLYNAVNNSHYTNPEDIQITTIQDVLYMGMKNDVSFLLAETLSIYEHQSTLNPNLPARGLIYFGMVLEKYVEDERNKVNLYSSMQQTLPVPKLVCFYNGEGAAEERSTLELVSAFPDGADADISVRVIMLNINHGKNAALMESCQALKEYSWFIGRIREYKNQGYSVEEAVDLTLNEIPEDALLKPLLTDNRAEVKRMCITEYDEEKHMRMEREEHEKIGREEGIKEGIKVGVTEAAKIYRDELGLTPSEITEKISSRFNLPQEVTERYVAEALRLQQISSLS